MISTGLVPKFCRRSAPPRGAPRAIPWSGSNFSRFDWCRALNPAMPPGSAPKPCSTGSTPNCVRPLTPVATPKWQPCCKGSMAGSCGPARPARRPVAGLMCCRPGAISSRSMCAPCRRRRRGGSEVWRPSVWSKAIGRRPANGRAPSRCRPGAPPTCAPAATMSRRRWR